MFSFLRKKESRTNCSVTELKAYVSGRVIPIEEVGDGVFSAKTLGGGLAIEPTGETVVAPGDGVISAVMEDSKHAVGMTLDNGAEILIHGGIDTVSMEGEGFELYVSTGQRVSEGDKLFSFDLESIRSRGYGTACIFVLTNESNFPNVEYMTGIDVKQGDTTIVKF